MLEHSFQNKPLEIPALCWLTHAFAFPLLPIPQLRWLNQRRRHSPTQQLPLENRKCSTSCSRNTKFLKNFQELPVPTFTQGHLHLQRPSPQAPRPGRGQEAQCCGSAERSEPPPPPPPRGRGGRWGGLSVCHGAQRLRVLFITTGQSCILQHGNPGTERQQQAQAVGVT